MRLHPRRVMPKRGQAYEPEVPVKVEDAIVGLALEQPARTGRALSFSKYSSSRPDLLGNRSSAAAYGCRRQVPARRPLVGRGAYRVKREAFRGPKNAPVC
jgi:hypothetical protein